MKKTMQLLTAGCALALVADSSTAATVTFDSLTKMTNNGTNFNLSVVDGAASFQPNADTGSTAVVQLGDGTLLDWKLLGGSNLNGQVLNGANAVGYANGPAAFINDPTSQNAGNTTNPPGPGLIYTPSNWGQVWHSTDPGVGFVNPADQTTYTVLNSGSTSYPMGPITGTVDISTLLSGEFFFFAGGYQANTDYTVTLSGPGQSDVTATYKDIINANNNRVNTVIFDFDNAGLQYDTLTWQYKHNSTNSRGRFMGVAIDGVVPEPSSLALLGLGGMLIARRRRA